MSLVRLSQVDEQVVAKLGETLLSLVEQLRDVDLRAGLAEAGLEVELGKIETIRRALKRSDENDARAMASVLREIAGVVDL